MTDTGPAPQRPVQPARASLRLRAALPADAPLIVELVNSAYRGESSRAGWTTEADLLGGQRVDVAGVQALIEQRDTVVLVHEHDGELLACVELHAEAARCYLGMLTVKPSRQACGLGRALLAAAEIDARQRFGAERIFMTVIEQRTELIAWYERRGYRRTGEYRPFPYGDERFGIPLRPDLQFIVLEKSLV
ncbi:MAG: GNAT family N-acetyltransferase [Steroidobacteraceae bacterium]|nr:GNAT family N-acetyltransferase [Steroidobacteraceae bacterium]MDW8259755.1 GNAT family N-acetyltransferase [Gammaproteobacteria bacterium]